MRDSKRAIPDGRRVHPVSIGTGSCLTQGGIGLKLPHFIDADGSFTLERPENVSQLYFPLASETGLKSCVSPNLGGDAKLDQETFLLEPVSIENLHNNCSTRNFWVVGEDGNAWSLTGVSAAQQAEKFTSAQDDSRLTAGMMWHTMERAIAKAGIHTTITSFVPVRSNVEIMYVKVRNIAGKTQRFIPYAAVPVYGRSADNLRDHRNVTSMLHRIRTTEFGVLVRPTMSFDERGHRPNHRVYYVLGYGGEGQCPEAFYPTVEEFLGEGGLYTRPSAVYEAYPGVPAGTLRAGREAMGAMRFAPVDLAPGAQATFVVLIGVEDSEPAVARAFVNFETPQLVEDALQKTREYWKEKVNVSFSTGDADRDRLMKWICFQPFLRRLFGCSFLPHHDYGRGGRGWRDLWQDCLSLLLMEPGQVGRMIESNFGGVRVDGTNATIIGAGDGNFIADRNGIARVWMDHALWPQMTTRMYIDQTGDVEILDKAVPYFKDAQALRGTGIDEAWTAADGNWQLTESGEVYLGTVLEHLLIEQLTAFCDVGAHNIYRLRGADWNDALDMAAERGESVAFTCAYAGNLRELAEMLRLMDARESGRTVELMEEIGTLLNSGQETFASVPAKRAALDLYLQSCRRTVSGRKISVGLIELADSLDRRADWLTNHLRSQEWIDGDGEGWFNSYYDNDGEPVEGFFVSGVRMMLTGQVFAVMGRVADNGQIRRIVRSADHYLYRPEIGGYRLNTDFRELKFNMGRMFGFAYGEKENGAVFSHMTVMYANALYRRGFAKEGWKALKTLADAALRFETSRIYPGIPEYFSIDGRGMYHYLTGAASWYMMTMITQTFGVRGEAGDLVLDPKLVAEQFDGQGVAQISLTFVGRPLTVRYHNPAHKEYGEYALADACCGGVALPKNNNGAAVLSRVFLEHLPQEGATIEANLV